MRDITSFIIVIALWLAISFTLWRFHRLGQRRKARRQRELVAQVWAKVREASSVYDAIRTAIPAPVHNAAAAENSADLRTQTTALLRRVQEAGPFFDSVRGLEPQLRKLLNVEKCPLLQEILQIRRDLWAASEIILIDDVASLGDAFADAGSYEEFCREAQRLLFKGAAGDSEDDLIDLRLAVARADVEAFAAGIEAEIFAAEERERMPTIAEIVSYPISLARSAPGQLRVLRAQTQAYWDDIRLAARNLRESQSVTDAITELRRAREELPGRLNASLDKAAALARHGGKGVTAHYRVLTKAYDLQAAYHDALQKAPELSERGRQFVARLELAKRSEQLRETSKGAADILKRALARGLAHLIAALQRLQDRLADAPAPSKAAKSENASGGNAKRPNPRRADAPPVTAPSTLAAAKSTPGAATSAPSPAPSAPPQKPARELPPVFTIWTETEPPEKRPAPPRAVAESSEVAPAPREPNPQTLKRLSRLFGGKSTGKQTVKVEPERPVSSPPAARAQPAHDLSATRLAADKKTAAPKPAWPALDKLRAEKKQATPAATAKGKTAPDVRQTSAPAPATVAKVEISPKTSAIAAAKASALEPETSKGSAAATSMSAQPAAAPPEPSKAPRTSFFRRAKPQVDIIPPTKQAKSAAPQSGGIAEMLVRLRSQEADIIEAEAENPPPPPKRAPSLLAKLSAVQDTAQTAQTGVETSGPPQPEATQPTSKPAPKRGFFGFRRDKG
jgi:hypothetical protein